MFRRYVWISFILSIAILSKVEANQVSKDSWIAHFKTLMPSAFCSDPNVQLCWKNSPEQCRESAAKAAEECIAKLEKGMPEVLPQPQDGAAWGSVIGSCVGQTYARIHQKEFNQANATCKQLDQPPRK